MSGMRILCLYRIVRMKPAYIQVYTGENKGKTTASLGLVIRALGHGMKCCIVYFDKGGDRYGERRILDKLGAEYYVFGRDRIDENNVFDFTNTDFDVQEANRALECAKEKASGGEYDLVVLDEVNVAEQLGMLEIDDILKFLECKHEETEVVLTGRNAHKSIIEKADLVTEMKGVKHYFTKGQIARKGIEF